MLATKIFDLSAIGAKLAAPPTSSGGHLGFWARNPLQTRFADGNMSNIQKYIITDLKMPETLGSRGGADILQLHAALLEPQQKDWYP